MAKEYRPVDRDQIFLLPPNVRDWLPADHLVWFVLDTVEALDTTALHARYRTGGAGRAAYDPDVLLGLVVYAWSRGVRSSRQVERLCAVDVGFMVACGLDTPHHSTLSRFVAACSDAVEDLFTQVLALCARAGAVKLGQVAVDGTKIAANASPGANRTRETVEKQLATAEEALAAARPAAARAVAEQLATDTAEDAAHGTARGDELPADLARTARRVPRLKAALAELDTRPPTAVDARRVAAAEPDPEILATGRGKGRRKPPGPGAVAEAQAIHDRHLAEATARQKAWQDRADAGWRPRGNPPVDPEQHCRVREAAATLARARQAAADHAATHAATQKNQKVNLTDPDSRVMPTRNGWVQGYNAQFVSTDDHFVLACALTQDTGDRAQLDPMVARAVTEAARLPAAVGLVVADNGYWNPTAPDPGHGPDRLVATANRRTLAKTPDTTGPPPEHATPLQAMDHRLATDEGRTAYKRRGATVEPLIGMLKDLTGLRRFRRRGLHHTTDELTLACTVHNLRRLYNLRTLRTATTHPQATT